MLEGQKITGASAEAVQTPIAQIREAQDQMLRIESSIAGFERILVTMGLSDNSPVDPTQEEVPRATDLASIADDMNKRVRIAANRLGDLVDLLGAQLT